MQLLGLLQILLKLLCYFYKKMWNCGRWKNGEEEKVRGKVEKVEKQEKVEKVEKW